MLGVLLAAGACGTGAPASSPIATTPVVATSPTLTPTPSATPLVRPTFPLAVRDDEATALTLPAEPQRIISLTPAVTETLYALGEGGKLVGGTDADDYPAAAKALPHVATFQGVIVEKVVALKPDLVIAGGNGFNPPADIARLRGLGIPVAVVYAGTVDAVLADIRLIGELSGAYPAAVALTQAMAARIAAVVAAAAVRPTHPRVFYELGAEPAIYGPADDSFVADLIRLAGGDPITTGDARSFTISLERLVAADPQVIVLGDANYGATAVAVARRPGWGGMTAVRVGAIRPVDDVIVTRPGPRLADGLAALAVAIDPTLSLPSASPSGVGSPAP